MKKIVSLLIVTLVSITCSARLNAADFGRRFGVNGYLTSLPLYYKERGFNNVSRNQKRRLNRKRINLCSRDPRERRPVPVRVRQ